MEKHKNLRKVAPSDIVNKIQKLFPEFLRSEFFSKDNIDIPYVFVGDFGEFAVDQLKNRNHNVVERIVTFINGSYENSEDEDKNLIWIGFIELVTGDLEWYSILRERLTGDLKTEYKKRF